ncbi:glycosyltransferase family A protein [Staphylococcus equorum]|nr:glycosyltransferase family A protein [Staphylococcus equorum]MDK9861343.1 glycosyltransferase family A protein [Staphylococcus equorum]
MKIIKNNKKNNKIKVSVLISTYNKEKFIKKTLDSILNQTMDKSDFEIIVVDDCSTDSTPDIVSKQVESFVNYQFVQLDENSGTPAKPRNLSIDLSKGKYILFVDGDD